MTRTNYYYDTEFLELGYGQALDLISIGIVCEDGREYYAVNSDVNMIRVHRHDWLMENVVPSLPTTMVDWTQSDGSVVARPILDTHHKDVKPLVAIAAEVLVFLTANSDGSKPKLWAWYGAYDHVMLAQLWGRMVDMPEGLPKHTYDLKQEADRLGGPKVPTQAAGHHNALYDAWHNVRVADFLRKHEAMLVENGKAGSLLA